MVGHQGPPYCFVENNRVDGDASQMTKLKQGPLNGGMIPRDGPGLPGFDSSKVGESIARKAMGFLDDHLARNRAEGKERPFYIHFCSDGAHGPYTPPETLLGSPVKGASKMTAHTDMVHEVDVLVGKLVEALSQRGLLTNTLILLTSDNGGLPFEREHGHDAVGGLRGQKSFIFEGGHRVPYLLRWGDGTPAGSKIPPGTVRHQVVGAHDIVPTMAELAGARLGPDQALDSVSLVPVLLGQRDDQHPVRQTLLVQSSPGRDAFMDRPAGGDSRRGQKPRPSARARAKQKARRAWRRTRPTPRPPGRRPTPAAMAWLTPCAKDRGSSPLTCRINRWRFTTSPKTSRSRRTALAIRIRPTASNAWSKCIATFANPSAACRR